MRKSVGRALVRKLVYFFSFYLPFLTVPYISYPPPPYPLSFDLNSDLKISETMNHICISWTNAVHK